MEETHNLVGTTQIVDGTYEVSRDEGLVAGNYLVSITATRKTGRQVLPPETLEGEPRKVAEEEQYIPQRYNVDSELQVELDGGRNEENFNLE